MNERLYMLLTSLGELRAAERALAHTLFAPEDDDFNTALKGMRTFLRKLIEGAEKRTPEFPEDT
jgi:hypothetical protein